MSTIEACLVAIGLLLCYLVMKTFKTALDRFDVLSRDQAEPSFNDQWSEGFNWVMVAVVWLVAIVAILVAVEKIGQWHSVAAWGASLIIIPVTIWAVGRLTKLFAPLGKWAAEALYARIVKRSIIKSFEQQLSDDA